MTSSHKIIILEDLLATKQRKEKELAYYQAELKKLEDKMMWIRREIKLTTEIIDMIEHEKVVDIKRQIRGE